MKKKLYAPVILRLCLASLAALQIAALAMALERPAYAYIDPGSGFVFLQVAGSMLAGAVYYLRGRLKKMFGFPRKHPQLASPIPSSSEVVEHQS